jgi:hypothetical protein
MSDLILGASADQLQPRLPIQRTVRGIEYERFIRSVRQQLRSMTAADRETAKRANDDLLRGLAHPQHSAAASAMERVITPGAVHVDQVLSNMSVMYSNDEYIGERLMPAVPVAKRSGKFAVYNKRDRFAFPDDLIGYRSSPNELEAGRTFDNYSVADYGYKNYLDYETTQNQDAPLNEMVDVVEAINEGIAFRREKRILAIVATSANYSGNTAAAGSVWSGTTGGSLIADILAAVSALWSGPTPTRKVGFCSLAVWNTGIANNPAIRELFKYTENGLATTTQVARFFGLDDILVSRAREDTANSGQTAAYARMLTGNVFGVLAVADNPSVRSLHFGSTFRENDDPFTTEWPDPGIGKRGGIWSRVSVSEDHKIVAPDAGFLITSVVS